MANYGASIIKFIIMMLILVVFLLSFNILPSWFSATQRDILFYVVIGTWIIGFLFVVVRGMQGR